MRVRYGAVALAALVTVALAACGTDSPARSGTNGTSTDGAPARRAQDLDPCTMVTKEELTAALTQPPGEPEAKGGGGLKQCDWSSESDDRYLVLQVLFAPAVPAGTKDADRWTKAKFDEYWSPGAEPLSGVGDAAYQVNEKDGVTLFVLDGPLAFSVAIVFYSSSKAPAADVTLAALKPVATAIARRY